MSLYIALPLALSILLWSLYPVAISYSLNQLDVFVLTFYVQLFAALGAAVFGFFDLARKGQIGGYWKIQRRLGFKSIHIPIIAGLLSSLGHLFIIFGLLLSSKAGVTLLFETWPLLALLFTPALIKKNWSQINPSDYVLSAFAVGGMALIVLSDPHVFATDAKDLLSFSDFNSLSILGYVLALGAGYMTAYLVVMKIKYAHLLQSMKNDYAASMVSETIMRGTGALMMLGVLIVTGRDLSVSLENLYMMAFIGVVVLAIGGATYCMAFLRTQHANLHIAYYLVPVLAVAWLYIFGDAVLNAGIMLGGFIIIAANVVLLVKNNKKDRRSDIDAIERP